MEEQEASSSSASWNIAPFLGRIEIKDDDIEVVKNALNINVDWNERVQTMSLAQLKELDGKMEKHQKNNGASDTAIRDYSVMLDEVKVLQYRGVPKATAGGRKQLSSGVVKRVLIGSRKQVSMGINGTGRKQVSSKSKAGFEWKNQRFFNISGEVESSFRASRKQLSSKSKAGFE